MKPHITAAKGVSKSGRAKHARLSILPANRRSLYRQSRERDLEQREKNLLASLHLFNAGTQTT